MWERIIGGWLGGEVGDDIVLVFEVGLWDDSCRFYEVNVKMKMRLKEDVSLVPVFKWDA